MAKLALNKTTLNREGRRLKAFRQFVPALDLKRKQLLSARVESSQKLQLQQQQLAEINQRVAEQIPMLAAAELTPDSFLQVKELQVGYSNLVGLQLPYLQKLEIAQRQYSHLLMPHWLDSLLILLKKALTLEVEISICQNRLAELERGLLKTTQRLNLFDKVLIPRTEENIRKVRIALSDAERAGVVRAKIAKNKRRRVML